jgi:hypothetical protein
MAPLITEARVFANQFMREIKRREAVQAGAIFAGATTWMGAMCAAAEQVQAAAGPVKQARAIAAIIARLKAARVKDSVFVPMAEPIKSRRANLMLVTLHAGKHPFQSVEDEDGIHVSWHTMRVGRQGGSFDTGIPSAFACWHTIGRIRERSDWHFNNVVAALINAGIFSFLNRSKAKHDDNAMAIDINGMVLTGAQRVALHEATGSVMPIFDIRTVLPANEITSRAHLEQGRAAAQVVSQFWNGGDGLLEELIEQVPVRINRHAHYSVAHHQVSPIDRR